MRILNRFYLDQEKDVIISLYTIENSEKVMYVIETPNHHTGNLITNLAKICGVETQKDENDMKIIKEYITPRKNKRGKNIYFLKLGNINIASFTENGKIKQNAIMPALIKTFMSQTKNYELSIEKSILNLFIPNEVKLRTDLHTHQNSILTSDILVALGIKHQLRFPLIFVEKLGLKLTEKQITKYQEFNRDYINFADLIMNNTSENANHNVRKIRNSLAILKDGQATIQDMEDLYLYRYIFTKGMESEYRVKINIEAIYNLEDKAIRKNLLEMYEDTSPDSLYKENTLQEDKFLWIARQYKKQGVYYVEIAATDIVKTDGSQIEMLNSIHKILPLAERETGVKIRMLAAIRRTFERAEDYESCLDVLKVVAKDPYVVGSDIISEELNDINELKSVIEEIVEYVVKEDPDFTIRIHAGENEVYKTNVKNSIKCVEQAAKKCGAKQVPSIRIGHGLYGENPNTEAGKKLTEKMKKYGVVLEFNLTSNVRLNNLADLNRCKIKHYLDNGVHCVLGTDGCGFYGTDIREEQIALRNLLGLRNEDYLKIKTTENHIMKKAREYFEKKKAKFNEELGNRTIEEFIQEGIIKSIEERKKSGKRIEFTKGLDADKLFKNRITKMPEGKMPVIVAGGSFNSQGRETVLTDKSRKILEELVERLSVEKAYFVVGHKMQGYEKELIDVIKEKGKKFQVTAVVPRKINEQIKENIEGKVDNVYISKLNEEAGIYMGFRNGIFDHVPAMVFAFDGNSPVNNLIQDAKNTKNKTIYVNEDVRALREKAELLQGYVKTFKEENGVINKILSDYPDICG